MEKIVESFELYGKQYRFETGELAKQATGAVLVTQGDTTILVTAVVSISSQNNQLVDVQLASRRRKTTTSSPSRSTTSRRCTPSAASPAAT